MRLASGNSVRRGAVAVEAAIVLPVFLLIVLGMIDLALAVMSQNALSEAARDGSRQAVVHGELAPSGWKGGPWGPTPIDEPGTATGIPAVAAVEPMLSVCPLDNTRVQVEWLTNSNKSGSPVRVTASGDYHPLVTYIFGSPSIRLSASSTMPIAH